jgi:hypothetical protein
MAMLRCKTPFLFDGRTYRVDVDVVDENDPIAASHGAFFEPVAPTRESSVAAEPAVVEQATAAPGEKRTAAPKG